MPEGAAGVEAPADGRAFRRALLAWFRRNARDLPWRRTRDPYVVWLSEVMLQQTRVEQGLPYFERFVEAFPTVRDLAAAPRDRVLKLWEGLGYYARAAQRVRDQHGGVVPTGFEALSALPGIGRSTAAAILALSAHQHHAILDGNVKRVLARVFRLTPTEHSGAYTQAIMDLGATLCTRSRPACALCPLAADCAAKAEGNPGRYPTRKLRRALGERRCQMLVIRNPEGEILLEKRPASGIWGGLWSFPEIGENDDPVTACDRITGAPPASVRRGEPLRNTFSHFRLDATPVFLGAGAERHTVMEDARLIWYKPGNRALGLAAPVKRLIDTLDAASLEIN